MWTLKYQYELEDGSVHSVSCCLRRSETYSIGRSSKNLLNVKNDKSISREHVSLSWDGNERQLVLVNQGKMTMTGGKYMKIRESVNFNASQSVINVELGTKPLIVELQWVECFWDVPPSCSEFALSLEELGVEVLLADADERSNLMILDSTLDNDEDRCLYGLIKGVPLMNQKFLTEFCAAVSGSETDFETLWSKMMINHDLRALPQHASGKGELIFEGLEFFLLCPTVVTVNKYMEKAIQAAGGKISKADNMQELQNIVQLRQSTNNIVVLDTSLIKEDLASPVHKTFSLKDVIEAVVHGDISNLMNGVSKSRDSSKRPVEITTTTQAIEKPSIEKPSTKRRRLNRPKVKPLDSLSFFAGGETLREQPTSVEGTAGLTSQSLPEDTLRKGEIDISKVVYSKSSTDELASKSLGNLESVPSKLINTEALPNRVLSNQSTEGHSEDALIPTAVPVQPNKLMKTSRNRALVQENESPVAPVTGSQTRAHTKRTPTLSSYKSSEPRKKSSSSDDMIQVIQDAKNREVKRLSSTIVQVDQEELTYQAIQKLGDLALVGQNDSLLRQKNGEPTSDCHESHPEWNHRKNFKKFVKVWPQYRRQEDQTAREGSSDTIRNRAFLLTRQYVPMRKYTPGSDRQLHEDLYDFPEHNTETRESRGQRFDGEEQFSFSRASRENGDDTSNNLFVVDEDDESQNGDIPEVPVPRSSATTSGSVGIRHQPEIAIQEEDSDDEPTFTFKRKKKVN
ncbi:XRS2 (YDR369C) [Zygosaccharomyces parabailii]|nr:XRS2 (YDR369C) [Zygosaccharomyces parabailii]CDH14191.1 uncharacterized protein ZBAI_05977 [Zygosaccharomyces bailii ISA1307]